MPERMRRVNEAVREVVGTVVTAELSDPRIGFTTITGAEVSPDLRHGRVFVSVLGTADERSETLQGLRSAHGYIQRRVARELHLKNTPLLTFEHDDSIERGMRISEILENE